MGRDDRWFAATNKKGPARFTAGLEAGEDLFARTRVLRAAVNPPGRFYLRAREASWAIGRTFGSKPAMLGILQHAVFHAVERVAGFQHGFVEQGKLFLGKVT